MTHLLAVQPFITKGRIGQGLVSRPSRIRGGCEFPCFIRCAQARQQSPNEKAIADLTSPEGKAVFCLTATAPGPISFSDWRSPNETATPLTPPVLLPFTPPSLLCISTACLPARADPPSNSVCIR